MIKAVIFDLDGTVTNTMPLCIRAFREALEPIAGCSFTDEQITQTFGPSEEGTIMQLLSSASFERGLSAYLETYARLLSPSYGPFSGITGWLHELKRHQVRLALVTGKGAESTKLTLDYYGLNTCFSLTETGSAEGPVKPENIKKILSVWALNPEEVIYVGDAPSDINAAHEAGIGIISAIWGVRLAGELKKIRMLNPDCSFSTVQDAAAWLKKHITDKTTDKKHAGTKKRGIKDD